VLRGRFEGKAGWCSAGFSRASTGTHSIVFERRSNRSAPQTFCGFLPAGSTSTRNTGSTGRGESPTSSGSSLVSRYPQRRGNRAFLPGARPRLPREWLDEITLSGEMAWGRLWGSAASPIRSTPVCIVPRDELETWTSLSKPADAGVFGGAARESTGANRPRAMFPQELARASRLLAAELDVGLGELVARGLVTCDSFGGLRSLLAPPSRRRVRLPSRGAGSLLCRDASSHRPSRSLRGSSCNERASFSEEPSSREAALSVARFGPRASNVRGEGDVRGGRFVRASTANSTRCLRRSPCSARSGGEIRDNRFTLQRPTRSTSGASSLPTSASHPRPAKGSGRLRNVARIAAPVPGQFEWPNAAPMIAIR